MNLFAAIMAGGSGTRFWPASRKAMPKQFLSFSENHESLIYRTCARILPIVPADNQLVITNKAHRELVKKHLPFIPEKNIVAEPEGRNTAPCLALASLMAARYDEKAVIIALPSDQLVGNEELLNRAFSVAAKRVYDTGAIVTIGIKPTRPETGYGYIQSGEKFFDANEISIHKALCFVEKPNLEVAQKYLASGDYLWNAGIFVFRADVMLAEIERQLPKLYEQAKAIAPSIGKNNFEKTLEKHYPLMPKISIDYGVMEGAKQVEVVPLNPHWYDVGSWAALRDVSPVDANGNVVKGDAILIDSKNNIVYSKDGLVSLIGVSNLTVIFTHDCILVLPAEESQRVREVVALLTGDKEKYS